MFNDRNGVLYYSSRVRAFMGSRLSGSEPFIAYGLYRYDHTTGIWTALGGTVESAVPDAFNFNKVLYWDHTTSFEAFQTSPRFDTQNRLHFVISGHTDDLSDATQIYARSDDQGKTWKKADDTVIPGLPLRAKKGERDQGQVLIVTRENGMSGVKIDKDGKIATMIHYVWNTWNGTAWVPIKGGAGILGPDGMMTGEEGGAAITRMAGIDQPITAYEVELNFNLTATGQNQNIVLTWLPLWPHATSYTIKRSATPGGPYAVIAKGVPGLTYTDIKLANGKPYYYVVSASNEVCGESANSREIKGTPFRWTRLLQYKSLDTEDTGTVSASAENPPNEGAARAFDGDRGKWLFSASSAWLQYKFADKPGPAVTHYGMYSCYDYTERDPKDWEFLGSHDGETWETLDVQKNQTFDEQHRLAEHCPRLEDIAKQAAVEPNTYSFENPKCYQYYRLNITKTRGGGLGSLIELVLWADGVVYKTPPPFTPFPSAKLKTPASVPSPLVRK